MKKLTIKPSPSNLAVFKESDRYDCDDEGNGILHHLVILKAPLFSIQEAITRLKLTPHTFNKELKTPIDIAIESGQTDIAEYLLSQPVEVDEPYLEWMLGTLAHHYKEAKDIAQQNDLVGFFTSRIAGDGFLANNTHPSHYGFTTNALFKKYYEKYVGHLYWLEGKALITQEDIDGLWLGIFLPMRINVMLRLWLESHFKKPTPNEYITTERLKIKNVIAEIKRDLQTLWIERYGQKIEKHPFRDRFLNALYLGIMGSIKQLPEHSGIILYTGWKGHALYTVIKRLTLQQYQLTVHNLGEGASWHQEKIEIGVTKNYPYPLGMVDVSAFDNMGVGFIYIKNVLNTLFPKQTRVIAQKIIYDKDDKVATKMNNFSVVKPLEHLLFEPLRQQTVGNCVLANHDASRNILIADSVRDWMFKEERAVIGKIKAEALGSTIDPRHWRLEIFPLQKMELQWPQKPPLIPPKAIKWIDREGEPITLGERVLIGQGGFGDVYLAKYGSDKVVIKALRFGKLVPTKEDMIALDFEAVMQSQCSHFPNILRLIGLCPDLTQPNSIALITEYAPRGDLNQVLSDKKTDLSWLIRWQIAIDMSSGLCYLHDLNILHRDLKSTNIGIFGDFTAKIMDFGHAKMSDLYSRSNGTQGLNPQTGGATLRWNAPETFEDSYKFVPSADIYSLGMILWEIATREQPFGNQQNPVIIMTKISQGQLGDIPPITPKDFSEMIAETRKFKSFERPTAEQLQKSLEEGFYEFKNQLLLHVARGEQDEAEALIQIHPELLLAKATVTDYSGRKFTNITPFQYALWALDWHMWKMILKYLPSAIMKTQLKELEANGTEHGIHYDITPLLGAYQTLINNYDSWDEETKSEYWCKTIGGVQAQVPAHIAQEYCQRSLEYHEKGVEILCKTELRRDFRLDAQYDIDMASWYPVKNNPSFHLGVNFAFYRLQPYPNCCWACRPSCIYPPVSTSSVGVKNDFTPEYSFFSELNRIRKEQYIALKT